MRWGSGEGAGWVRLRIRRRAVEMMGGQKGEEGGGEGQSRAAGRTGQASGWWLGAGGRGQTE